LSDPHQSTAATDPGSEVLAAALRRWEPIARYAWAQHAASGPGVVLVSAHDLLAADEALTEQGRGPGDVLPLSYVPAGTIPRGDDFSSVISGYDPRRQVALLVGGEDGQEQLFVLEPAGPDRPAPPDC
jgi:hypothetical protein